MLLTQPPRFRHLAVLCFAALLAHLSAFAAPDKAQPKDGKSFTPPLSERIPESVSALPRFGGITWETTALPWVGEGPYDGISGAGMAEINGVIYVVGGFIPGGDGSGDSASRRTSRWTMAYDPGTQRWTRLAHAPFRREYTRAIAAGGELYLAGGACQYKKQDPPYLVHGDCAGFDPGTGPKGAWKALPALQVSRTHMAVGYAGGRLLVAGGNEYDFAEKGYSHNTIRGTLESLDPLDPASGWREDTPIPGAPRGWCASTVANEALYLFGGITWDEDNATVATPETLRYDAAAGTWTVLAPPPLPVSGWEGALYQGRYAINVGGVVRPAPGTGEEMIWSDLALAYDTQEDQWLQVDGVLPPGAVFNDPGVVIIGDTIYVLGAEGPDGSHFNYFLIGQINQE